MKHPFPFYPFRNVLFSILAGYTDIALHVLLQQPAPSIDGAVHGVLLPVPPVVLAGPDLHQPELLNPQTLQAALHMMPHAGKKFGSLQSIELRTDALLPGQVYLFETLLDTYQQMIFFKDAPNSEQKAWEQLIQKIETDPHLKALVEHYLYDDVPLSVRHYRSLLQGIVGERSIHNALKEIKNPATNRPDHDAKPLTNDGVDVATTDETSTPLSATAAPEPSATPGDLGGLTPRTLSALTNIKKASHHNLTAEL